MATTPNLGLHQWQPGDSFLRTDFNTDLGKIDAAIGAGLKCKTGSLTGDDTAGRVVSLGMKPKFLLLFGTFKNTYYTYDYLSLVGEGYMGYVGHAGDYTFSAGGGIMAVLTADGFRINDAALNPAGYPLHYVAWG